MTDITIDVKVNLEDVKELRRELEKIKELQKEINNDNQDEEVDGIDLPDNDPLDIPDPSPRDPFEPDYPDRKFPKWYVRRGRDEHQFSLEIEEDDNTLVDKTVEL